VSRLNNVHWQDATSNISIRGLEQAEGLSERSRAWSEATRPDPRTNECIPEGCQTRRLHFGFCDPSGGKIQLPEVAGRRASPLWTRAVKGQGGGYYEQGGLEQAEGLSERSRAWSEATRPDPRTNECIPQGCQTTCVCSGFCDPSGGRMPLRQVTGGLSRHAGWTTGYVLAALRPAEILLVHKHACLSLS
jgi:hypothetical protein